MKIHLDFETRSAVDLKKVGAWAYALHSSTEITCIGFGADAARVQVIGGRDLGFDWRKFFISHVEDVVFSAHNAAFEYAIYNCILHKRFGWPARWDPRLWRCTMARAAMVGLPLGLDDLTRVLPCRTVKDLEGRRVMLQLCKPTGFDALGDPVFDEDPAKYKRLYAYNRTDVLAEMEVDALLPELPASEQAVWELDLVMNRRGIQIDTALAKHGADLSFDIMGPINDRVRRLTDTVIDTATQNAAIIAWIEKQGVEAPTKYDAGEKKKTLDKVGVTELLMRPDLPPVVRDVVLLKRQASKRTSTAKFSKALEMVCSDGRVRGNLQYHGAHTGRWSGRLLQAHNFPQGYGAEVDGSTPDQDLAVRLIMSGDAELFSFTYGDRAMEALSDALRSMIVAAPGKQLISADYNAIEARGVFWLAGEEAALATYRAGGSPYLEMGEYVYRRKITKKGDPREYDIAKRTVLGAGFGMGWEKFRDNIYAETAKKGAPVRISDELSKKAIEGYRTKYGGVPRMWKEVEAAAVAATRTPGQRYTCCGGRVLWSMSNDRRFLVCRLPSGRYLWYWKPSVGMAKTPWGEEKPTLLYWGSHPKTGEWCQLKTYGGALTENIVQATARDVMAHGMLKAEAAGYEMILTVHDELLAEMGTGESTLKHFMDLMCDLPPWAAGFPVAAEGWVSSRYRK